MLLAVVHAVRLLRAFLKITLTLYLHLILNIKHAFVCGRLLLKVGKLRLDLEHAAAVLLLACSRRRFVVFVFRITLIKCRLSRERFEFAAVRGLELGCQFVWRRLLLNYRNIEIVSVEMDSVKILQMRWNFHVALLELLLHADRDFSVLVVELTDIRIGPKCRVTLR